MDTKLNVQAIFRTIDGEANGFMGSGQLTTFIRLRGCNFNQYGGCIYCDTVYAQDHAEATWMTIDEVLNEIGDVPKVSLSGGEVMVQHKAVRLLLEILNDRDCKVSVETNGSIDFFPLMGKTEDLNIRYIVDWKLPSSGMMEHMNENVFAQLGEIDVIKFVISDEVDYNTAKKILADHPNWLAKIVFSPAIIDQKDYSVWPAMLANMMVTDKLYDIQYSLQIHKCLWPNPTCER